MATGSCVFDLRIDDVVQGEVGPIDAGITSVARKWTKSSQKTPAMCLFCLLISISLTGFQARRCWKSGYRGASLEYRHRTTDRASPGS
jgi:hypothetical protein